MSVNVPVARRRSADGARPAEHPRWQHIHPLAWMKEGERGGEIRFSSQSRFIGM
jgi:hypothetical protein